MSTRDVFTNNLVKEIIEKYRVLWALKHVENLMSWDSETYMPRDGVEERSIAAGQLAVLTQQLLLKPEFVELVEKASKQEDLNDYERGVIRVLHRAIRIAKKLPPRLVKEIAVIGEKARHVWREAKIKNDYELFKPYLSEIVKLNREVAEHLGYDDHPYDALLDLFEEGMKTIDVQRIFDVIIPFSKKALNKVLEDGHYPQSHELENTHYDVEQMKLVNKDILDILGYPWDRGRLDTSAHPFTMSMGIRDVRITTRYEGYDFKRTMFSVIHEFGHALYELQIDERLMATPLAGGVSLGIHESQSRFWENIVGRSREFSELVYPILRKRLNFIGKYNVDDIYLYFNTVKPSLIRTEADEVTYNFHIYLRFEAEKLMLTGELSVEDLPEYWDKTMDELLGIKPRNYSEGVLQDIHWSLTNMGYFPTYTIGNVVAAQIRHYAIKEKVLSTENILEGKFSILREWLREKVHKWGSTYPPKDLLKKSFGESLNPEYFVKYIEEKYLR